MGKRSKFPRVPKDLYETPRAAVEPLLPFLRGKIRYYEPCCGNAALVKHLKNYTDCVGYSDDEVDARTTDYGFHMASVPFDMFVTNPPWSREILHPIIKNLIGQKPTWLLLDADWAHTRQSAELITHCEKIVSVGRVKWIAGSQHTSKDNCCWYYFTDKKRKYTEFYGRQSIGK